MGSAKDLNIDDLKGMPDVKFDFTVSSDLKRTFRAAATLLSGQRSSRSTWRSTAATDFKGYFSEIFTSNGTTQLNDLDEIVSNLRLVATQVEGVEQDAREENSRRKTAREWAQRQKDRNWLERRRDDIFGGEDPPDVEISDSGPSKSVPAKTPGTRQTPPPGSGGGSGGTTSARPSDLRTFATNTSGGDDSFNGTVSGLNTQVTNFSTSCSWATLDASGPIDALKEWLRLNGEDGKWATTVADAFKRAGGEGNISYLNNSTIAQTLKNKGIAVSRSDIKVDPPTAYGSPPTTGYSDDPINTATGNFIENEVDLGFTGSASVLSLARTYNSLSDATGGFGRGWNSWSEARLTLTDEAARLRLFDGREIVFPRLGEGWDRATGQNMWLSREPSGNGQQPGLIVTNSDGLRWIFTADGRLLSTDNGPGTTIDFGYDDAGRLATMRHEFGRSIRLDWDDRSGLIAGAESSDGRRVSYSYDDSARLVAAITPAGTRTYRWNEDDLIEAVIDADGVVEAENTYDEQARVVTQRSPFGRVSRFVYLNGGVTAVSDEDGNRNNTWISDGKGRLIGVIDAEDNRQSTSYDRYGNPVMITERNGAVTVNSYDDRGRRTEQVMPSGARVRWTYDATDRPVTVAVTSTDDHGAAVEATTHYSYDGDERDPSRVIDPEGGVTLMTWADGLLKKIVDPEGVTLRFDHDQHGELIASTDADGNVARLERDDLGRVVAAVTPLGNRTSYRYDGAGALLSRQDPDGAIWRYETTAGGRVTAIIDPLGGRTEVEYGEHGEQSRMIDELGRAVTSAYDDLGNPTRSELPDGSAWEFGYDAMSRLTSTTDANGASWQVDYDKQGFVSRTVDPTGVEETVERDIQGRPTRAGDLLAHSTASYDALGRTVTEAGPDGAADRYRYDLCGRLIEHTDPTGATTKIKRDAAGRPVAITHPMGTTYRYEYDDCGRRAATIDTDGSRYAFSYDGDGRLIREDWPTGEQAWLSYDECGRVVQRFEPGKGTATFGYDKLGRVVRLTDGWYGRRKVQYDAAGQLVGVTNAAGGQTRFEYDEVGQCVATIDPLGSRTERRFDIVGRLIAEIDPLGRTTRYGYDAAGRQTRRIDPTGSELSWSYDRTGRLTDTLAGDRLLSTIERDFTTRTMRVREGDTINELVWDENGQLIRRMRSRDSVPGGGIGLSWSYDGDGRRTAFTRSDGTQTQYEYDQAGRVTALTEPGLGRAVIDRDAIGRIVSMTAPGLHATWVWDGGVIVRHQVTRNGETETTEIERDDAGRVVAQRTNDVRISYGYDAAGQLVEARRSDGSVTSYGYDASGRLIKETTDGRSTSYTYDSAGQLLSRRGPDGVTDFGYDAGGRRISEAGPEADRRFSWDPQGYLSKITTITHANDKITARTQDVSDDHDLVAGVTGQTSTQSFQVDALGELAAVDGQSVAWDSAAGLPALAQVGEISISNYGPLTALLPDAAGHAGESGGWLTPDWRPRSTGVDPWGVAPGTQAAGLPSGVAIGGQANLVVGGMEWMQARVYDPGSRGFLSTDPLDPVLGSGWAGNPYSFAGNDPLNQSDPWGLKPVTDKELQAYRDSNNGAISNAWNATTSWVKNNWEYIAAGAMIVGGVALMCTGIGGPVGLALAGGALSMGMSVASQKATTGKVDWGQAGVDGLTGMIPIPGAGAAGAVLKTGAKTAVKEGLESTAKNGIRTTASGGLRSAESTVARTACFAAGTQVLMGDGSSKSIEDVQIGDEVVAADVETGETQGRRVLETYVHQDVATVEVETSSGRITSTDEHPFYVEGRGWTPVRDLRPGDRLVDPKGSSVEIAAIRYTGNKEVVYNFNVEGLHNYHVQTDGQTWIRVHNTCGTYAASARSGALLKTHLRQVEKYGKGGVRELESGRFRYYDTLNPARKEGEMAGRRLVREWDPATGGTRTWHETLDHSGRVRIVRPETGGPKVHYTFDRSGNYGGSW
ncbi:polymorphic toxin-type HINT domain-containing protein [Microlunatus soli]|uniref:Intein N-terminal splicing region/RHS repeat-associated core domain-containing protein n=1 Tax=Microlunatus soli TaxID=630515 RepID=A0A1H1TT33_9ACTN|nr:polymorphic toxin-type HINT domain-containing protein [Microlunatus soli]SDS63367.1 intein N-terminal splicing region/RHS repeat-associated core domain-containing protein [Microlunatus soli]